METCGEMEDRRISMFINYEHNNHLYNVEVERKKNKYFIAYDNNTYTVEASEIKPGHLKITLGDKVIKCVISEGEQSKFVFIDGNVFNVKPIQLTGTKKVGKKESDLASPISGKVVKVEVKEGETVKKGDVLMVIEAMKMEYLIRAPYDGTIVKIKFKENDQIDIGQNTVELNHVKEE